MSARPPFTRPVIAAGLAMVIGGPAFAATDPTWQAALDARYLEGLRAYEQGAYSQAIVIWNELSVRRHPSAAMALGMMYETGTGVEASSGSALDWYNAAELYGHPQASNAINRLLTGTSVATQLTAGEVEMARSGRQPMVVDEAADAPMQGRSVPRRFADPDLDDQVRARIGYDSTEPYRRPSAPVNAVSIPRASNAYRSEVEREVTDLQPVRPVRPERRLDPAGGNPPGGDPQLAGMPPAPRGRAWPYATLAASILVQDDLETADTGGASAELQTTPGYGGSVAGGLDLGPVRAEAELAYGNLNYERLRVGTTSADQGGSVEYVSGMLNLFTDLEIDERFNAHAGVGIGMINLNPQLAVAGVPAFNLGPATDLQLMGELGLGWRLGENLIVGPAWRYRWIAIDYPGIENWGGHDFRLAARWMPGREETPRLGAPAGRNLYVSLRGGLAELANYRLNRIVGEERVEVENDVGLLGGLAVGYRAGPWRFEVEGEYLRAAQDSVFFSPDQSGLADGALRFASGGLNLNREIARIMGIETYLGLGFGLAAVSVGEFSFGEAALEVNPSDSVDPYIHGEVGARIRVVDSIDIGPSIRYTWTDLDDPQAENLRAISYRLNTNFYF